MDNLEVAEYLLSKLNDSYQGVVYLDRNDQKMILLRSSRQSLKLSQSGVPWKNRFSFYDQVHTTGMDIKQVGTVPMHEFLLTPVCVLSSQMHELL